MKILTRYNSRYFQKYLNALAYEWVFIEDKDVGNDYDLIICAADDILATRSGNKIIIVELNTSLPQYFTIGANHVVYESRFQVLDSVAPSTVIYPWIDVDALPTWQGYEKKIISMPEQPNDEGWKKAIDGYEGEQITNTYISNVDIDKLVNCSFYLNLELSYNILLPIALGVPIMSVDNEITQEFICDKYLSYSKENLKSLFENPFQQKIQGLKNRFFVKSFFNKENFVYRWKKIIDNVL